MPAPARRFYYATYNGQVNFKIIPFIFFVTLVFLVGCDALPARRPSSIKAIIRVDHREIATTVQPGDTVQKAIAQTKLILGPLDKVQPALDTVLSDEREIRIVRVRQEFETQQQIIPFEHQQVRSGSLPEGENRIIQPGKDGQLTITVRVTYEDDLERSRIQYHSVTTAEPIPEITLIGTRAPYVQVPIPGRIVYLANGNVYLMDGSTGIRKPVLTSGDVDGRIFSLSPDGKWLLYTRKSNSDDNNGRINSLWAVFLESGSTPIDLTVSNVVHFASWVPGSSMSVAYSTVEPRQEAPGWQANNDLNILSISPEGKVSSTEVLIDTNPGGTYGWWGTVFAWSPDGAHIAYSRPDSVGLVDPEEKRLIPVIQLDPVNAQDNWVWTPGLSWSPDGRTLFTTSHPASHEPGGAADSFSLTAIDIQLGNAVTLLGDTGMSTNPAASPFYPDGISRIAYFNSEQSEDNDDPSYNLQVVNTDGTQVITITPEIDGTQMKPQLLFWSPQAVKDVGESIVGIVQGNLWIIPADGSRPLQVTGDGSITRLDWK